MEVKPGYKQTEVGVIPEEWLYRSVGQLIEEGIIEKPLDGNHGSIHPKSGDFVEYGIPFVMANNVQGGQVDLVNCSFIRKEQADSLLKGFLRTGDILLTHKATIGNTAMVGEIPFEYIMLTPQVTYYRVADENRLSNLYLRQFFDSAGFQSVLRRLAGGGTRSYIGVKAQHKLPVVVPPSVTEQRAIAEALSDVDGLLGALDRVIAKKRHLKQAAMQQLLTGQTRLPGFDDEWESKRFGEIAFPRRDRVDPRRTGVHDFCVELEHITSISGELLGSTSTGEQSSLKSVFRPGDVLFGKLRAYLRKYWLATRSGVCSTEVWVFTPRDRLVTTEFLFQTIKTDEFIEAASNSYGTHMPRSDWNIVKNYELKLPPLREQTAIAEVLSDLDSEVSGLKLRREKTRALKQAMMQELLTGRTRLVPASVTGGLSEGKGQMP